MAGSSAFQAFLRELRIKTRKPTSDSHLLRLESALGSELPTSVRACYSVCDGGQAQDDRSALELLSASTALGYRQVPRFFDSYWGYLPFAENNDSNPVCVCCRPPLAGYVVLVSHDDAPRLMYRSLDGFFRAAAKFVRNGEFLDTHQLPSDFAGPKRTKRDSAVARRLLDLGRTEGDEIDDEDRTDALRFACDLLSDGQIGEIHALLRSEDEYVREHAADRLKGIPGTRAKKTLRDAGADYDNFVERCAKRLQREGIRASVLTSYGKKTIRVDPGGIWLNIEVFYSSRNKPDVEEFLLDRVRFFIADEKKERQTRRKKSL
jgi:hypothetical protein